MSSAPAPSPSTEVLEQVRLWAASLSAESSSAASPVTWEILPLLPADAPAPAEGDVWMIAAFSGAQNGELGLRMTPVAALCLLHEPDPNSVLSTEQKSKLVEFFRKIAGGVATQSKAAGRDQLIQVEAAGAPAWPASTKYWLQAKMPAELRIEVVVSDALLASLQTIPPRDSVDPGPAAMPSKLGMFMDVELLVTMRFGGRRMLLKDILDLCTGSIVELDQQVQEPVDLLLDGKLIARGEVVVVDGNYGLRVTEILSNPVPAS